MLLLKIDHVYRYDTKLAHALNLCRVASDLFLVTALRYAASDNFNYLRGCLMLLPSVFSWAPDEVYKRRARGRGTNKLHIARDHKLLCKGYGQVVYTSSSTVVNQQ